MSKSTTKKRLSLTFAIILISVIFLLGYYGLSGLFDSDPYLAQNSVSLYDKWRYVISKRESKNDRYCLIRLEKLDIDYKPQKPFSKPLGCKVENAVRVSRIGQIKIPHAPIMTCRLVEALAKWESKTVQPLAKSIFNQPVTRITHFGTYNCRKMRNSKLFLSQHAYANAIDIAGFKLRNGKQISIEKHWSDAGKKGQFLKALKKPTCEAFNVTITPDGNKLHYNHFHIDMGFWWSCS